MRQRCRHALSALLLLLAQPATPLSFTLAPTQKRCVSEDIPAGSMLTGDWEFGYENNSGISAIEISGPSGDPIFKKDGHDDGHFAVTAKVGGLHHVCVTNNHATEKNAVKLNLKTALEVAHDTVAKKEHIEAIEAERRGCW